MTDGWHDLIFPAYGGEEGTGFRVFHYQDGIGYQLSLIHIFSRVNLYNPDFLESLVNLVEKYKIPPKYLNLELTESAFSDDCLLYTSRCV